MRRKHRVSPNQTRTRDGAILAAIGRMLAAQYDLAEPLSDHLADILNRLENSHEIGAAGIQPKQSSLAIGRGAS